jgi:hypothetical protein
VVGILYVCWEDCPNYFFEPVVGPFGEYFGNEVHRAHDGSGFGLAILVYFINPVELRHLLHLTEVFFGQGAFEVGFLGFQG